MENKSNKLLTERFQKLAGLTAIKHNMPFNKDLFYESVLNEATNLQALDALANNWDTKRNTNESTNLLCRDLSNSLRKMNDNADAYKSVQFQPKEQEIKLENMYGSQEKKDFELKNGFLQRWVIPLYLNYGNSVRRFAQQAANAGIVSDMDAEEYKKAGKLVFIGNIIVVPILTATRSLSNLGFKKGEVFYSFEWPAEVSRTTPDGVYDTEQFFGWLNLNVVDGWAMEPAQKAVDDYTEEPVIADPDPESDTSTDATDTSADASDELFEPEYTPFCKRNLKDGWYDANIVPGNSFLRLGDCGDAVEIAQEFVNEVIYKVFDDLDTLEVDGMYGPATINAVKKVQSKVGTSADGKYGKATHEAISKFLAAKPKIDQLPVNQKTELDRNPIKLGDLVPIAPAEERNTGQRLLDKIKANKQKRVQRRINRLNKKKAKLTRPKQF